MSISYASGISTSSWSSFIRLLKFWRGSVYKLLWRELLLFLLMFYAVNFVYRFTLNPIQKAIFLNFAKYCDKYSDQMPLTFVLGFYVATIYNRWWAQFQTMQVMVRSLVLVAWPDRLAFVINTHIRGSSDMAKAIRRTAIRYVNLCALLGLRLCSTAVHTRYPTMQHIIDAGFIREDELQKFESIATNYPKEYIPCVWATALYRHALKEKFISDPRSLNELYKETNDFRQTVRSSRFFGWISVPLIYTQVVTIAIYSFYLSCVFGRQQFSAATNQTLSGKTLDLLDEVTSSTAFTLEVYFPLFTVLELIIYIGWLKAAEVMMNPFGEDDDDFEMDFVLERNLEVAYVLADDLADDELFPKLDEEAQAKRINNATEYRQLRRQTAAACGSTYPGIGLTASLLQTAKLDRQIQQYRNGLDAFL